MISLSPSQTSFHSSTGDGDSRAEGFWEVERCRQIRFNYQVSEQLQILPNPSRFLSPNSEEESYVNAAVHADWQKTLTPTPSPDISPTYQSLTHVLERTDQTLRLPLKDAKEIESYSTRRSGAPNIDSTSQLRRRSPHPMVRRSTANANTKFFRLNSRNSSECLMTPIRKRPARLRTQRRKKIAAS